MGKSNSAQDQLLNEIDDLLRRNSLLESENQSLSDQMLEMARFKTISDSAEHGNATVDLNGKIVYINDYFARKHGYTPGELLGQNLSMFHTVKQMEAVEEIIRSMAQSGRYGPLEVEHVHKDGTEFTMLMSGVYLNDKNGKPEYIAASAIDIEPWKQAEKNRIIHLDFLKNLNRIDTVIRKSADVEQMMSDVLQATLEIFQSDRAWLLYPCDPDADAWSVPMERTTPEYPGAQAQGQDIPMTEEYRVVCKKALDANDVIAVNAEKNDKLFSVQSHMHTAIHPRTGSSWLFGLHQCSHARSWTREEISLFKEIGHRLSDALTNLLLFRNLQESEEGFQSLANASMEAIFFSKNGICLEANQVAVEMFGWKDRSEFIGGFGTEIIAPESHDIVTKNMLGGMQEPYEAIGIRKDGSKFPVTIRGKSIPYKNRGLVRATAIRDMTQQKAAEKLLIAEKEKASNYLELANVMFIALDPHGTVTLANKKACEVLDWNEKDIIGKNWFDNFLPVYLRKTVKSVARQIMNGNLKPVEVYENPILTKSGQERLISWHNTTIKNEAGEITGHLSSGEDITSRRQVEKKLLLSDRILETSPDHVSVVGSDYKYRYVNKAYTDAHGMPASQIIGVNVADLLGTEIFDKLVKSNLDMCFSGTKVSYESWFSFRETGNRYMAVTYLPLREKDGKINSAAVISHDITGIKKAELEKQELEKQILQAQKLESLGVLAGGIAHDFNNILMAILGNADLALMDVSTANPAYSNIKAIETAAKRAADLAKQMLAYSGKGKFLIEKIDLNEAVDEMTHILEVSISKKAVIKYHYSRDLPLIEADATQIRQIIMNLVTNASDAIERTSGVISIKTGAMDCNSDYLASTYIDESLDSGQYIYVEVTDTGCGMSMETQKKLFDPFFTTKFTGRGLGLSAVLGIIRGHRGAIKVYSEPGRGTSIRVLFPSCDCSAVSSKKLKGGTEEQWTCPGTILLVDDEETILSVGSQMLQRIGFDVLTASDGYEAVKVFQENASNITLVILDLIMPHLDGEETFRELRRIREDVRVIMCSGYNEQEVTQRFAGKSIAGFIHKPYRYKELAAKLKEILTLP
ncbi:MAG: PAS domain S-box protein [Candidatus Fermentibacteria bacterium]|nr:PAS domain S-box protein [Candidatus Fermentibacteria bacterium]